MAAVTIFIAKNNKTTTSENVTFWRLNSKLSNSLHRINFTKDSLADITGGYGHD